MGFCHLDVILVRAILFWQEGQIKAEAGAESFVLFYGDELMVEARPEMDFRSRILSSGSKAGPTPRADGFVLNHPNPEKLEPSSLTLKVQFWPPEDGTEMEPWTRARVCGGA